MIRMSETGTLLSGLRHARHIQSTGSDFQLCDVSHLRLCDFTVDRICATRWLAMTCACIPAARCARASLSITLEKRAQGNAGRPLRPQPRVRRKEAHEIVTTVTSGSSGIPRALGFNGLLRALPGESGFFATVISGSFASANLMPASRHQDHTYFAVRLQVRSSFAPKASTASRAQRP
jgi:hypothetical protein